MRTTMLKQQINIANNKCGCRNNKSTGKMCNTKTLNTKVRKYVFFWKLVFLHCTKRWHLICKPREMSNLEDDIFPLHIYESREEIAPVTTCLTSSLRRDQFKHQRESGFHLNTIVWQEVKEQFSLSLLDSWWNLWFFIVNTFAKPNNSIQIK